MILPAVVHIAKLTISSWSPAVDASLFSAHFYAEIFLLSSLVEISFFFFLIYYVNTTYIWLETQLP